MVRSIKGGGESNIKGQKWMEISAELCLKFEL